MTLDDVLHPPVEPLRTGSLPVSELHTLYWETCGSRDGIPALFLHGGPGAGISPKSRRFFDPARYHVVLFDSAVPASRRRSVKLARTTPTC